ncbi:MAG: acetoacetate decarboxylase family protein [Nocardioidaceae bacterium]
MPFPSPPWQMRAQMFLSLFALRRAATPDRPPGLYGAAFVTYQPGSVLTYRELLVARLMQDGRTPRVRITDIWVDSEQSQAAGRSLWALPKELAELSVHDQRGPVSHTTCAGTSIASASFTAAPALAVVRTPFAASTCQEREDGSVTVARFTGSARSLPCRAKWDFDADGPLGWLHGRRPFASFRMTDVRLTFGA